MIGIYNSIVAHNELRIPSNNPPSLIIPLPLIFALNLVSDIIFVKQF